MKKIDAGQFEVARGEEITITVTPNGVGPFVAASRAGKSLTPDPDTMDTRPTFKFTADKSSVVKMEFSFPGAPSSAKYVTVIKGSEGGQSQFTIKRTGAIKDPTLEFLVV